MSSGVEWLDIMKKTIAILGLAALGITVANAGVRFGLNVGIPVPAPVIVAPAPVVVPPPMPAPVVEVASACLTPGFVWVGGSWGWCDNHWVWTRGHWGPPAHWDHGYRSVRHEAFHGSYRRR